MVQLVKLLVVVVGVLAAPVIASAQEVACCVPTSTTCELLSETNCINAHGISHGSSCEGVRCGACCEGLGGGNPNACSDDFPIAACLEGVGRPVLFAHCAANNAGTSCVPDPPKAAAPAVRWQLLVGIAVLLMAAGIRRTRRRARP